MAVTDTALDLATLRPCSRCDLNAQLVTTLGEREGDGMIEALSAAVRFDPRSRMYALFHVASSHLLLFDESGRFVRRVGTSGRGPGELDGIVDAQFVRDQLVVLENGGPKLVQFASDGSLAREAHLRRRPGRFADANAAGHIVVAALDPSATPAHRLHVVDLATGEVVASLAVLDSAAGERRSWARRVLLARDRRNGGLWVAPLGALRFERWSADGARLQVVHGELPWFASQSGSGRAAPPRQSLLDFAMDSAGRLWTVTQIADARWRDAPRHGAEGFVLAEDQDRFFDVRLDVFDLRRRRYLGRVVWDETYAGLVDRGGEILVQRVQFTADEQPVVSLYRIDP